MERKKLIRYGSIAGGALLLILLIIMAMGGPDAIRGRKQGCFLRGTLRKPGDPAAAQKGSSGFEGMGQIVRVHLVATREAECKSQISGKCAEWVGGWGYSVEKLEGTWDPGSGKGPAIDYTVDGKCGLKVLRKRD
jgi:hypothetical protein